MVNQLGIFLTVPTKHIILGDYPDLPKLKDLLYSCDQWWLSKGVDLVFPEVERRPNADINTASDNPWPQTLNWWINQPDYDVNTLLVVFLVGWDSQKVIGWGGRPLALVGEYALQRIASVGTPDSLVDDWSAGKLLLHEEGHALGLPHDFDTVGAVMGYGHEGFNCIIGEKSDAELRRVWTPREDAYEACLR